MHPRSFVQGAFPLSHLWDLSRPNPTLTLTSEVGQGSAGARRHFAAFVFGWCFRKHTKKSSPGDPLWWFVDQAGKKGHEEMRMDGGQQDRPANGGPAALGHRRGVHVKSYTRFKSPRCSPALTTLVKTPGCLWAPSGINVRRLYLQDARQLLSNSATTDSASAYRFFLGTVGV